MVRVREDAKILDRLCSSCGQPIIEIAFNTVYAFYCDNDKCIDFRRAYYSRDRNNGNNTTQLHLARLFNRNRKEQPGYQGWLKRKRNGYRYARSFNFPSKRAARLADKSFEEIARIAEEELGQVVTPQ